MPALEIDDRRQKALYYAFVRASQHNEPIVRNWAELAVRWTHRRKELTAPDGTVFTIDATVKAGQALAMRSVMWEGGADDILGTANDPTEAQGPFFQVVTETRASDHKNRFTSRTYGLVRLSNALPTIEDEE